MTDGSLQIQSQMLDHYLQALKLPTMKASYKSQASDSLKLGMTYESFLMQLAEAEVLGRQHRRIQSNIKFAQFPNLKTLESFDFTLLPKLSKQLVLDLATCSYINNFENILLLGSSGTGKTHLATSLGLAACQNGQTVLFKTAAKLVHELMEAYDAKKLLSLQKKLKLVNLLIIDELGYVPFSKTGAELLFEVFSERYERGSMIVTSNLPFEQWPEVFGSDRMTGALLDRLTHHIHILEMNGDSYRLGSSKNNKYREGAARKLDANKTNK